MKRTKIFLSFRLIMPINNYRIDIEVIMEVHRRPRLPWGYKTGGPKGLYPLWLEGAKCIGI